MWPRLSPQDLKLFEAFSKPKENSPGKIQAIFFDIGSVLIDLDWDSFFARQHELNPTETNFSVERMMGRIRENQLMVRWCTGHIGPFAYVQGMLEAAGHSPEQAHKLATGTERLSNGVYASALVKELSSLIVGPVRPRIVRLIQRLRKNNYIVGALSNATPWHESDIMRTTSLHELFEVVLFSQDVGSEKPDRRIYESALQAASHLYATRLQQPDIVLTPSQLAFVDDTPQNVLAARELGWNASLVCLLKQEFLQKSQMLSLEELAIISTQSKNLVFGDEAAQRVEWLFNHLISHAEH